MKKHEYALDLFSNGYRCSQAVLSVYAKDYDLDPDLAKTISIALAGGSGAGGTCGAVTGAYLVIGLMYGFPEPGEPDKMRAVIDKNIAFVEKFKSIHGQIDCPGLTGLDIFSKAGQKKFAEENMKENQCANYVKDTVKILQEIMER